MLFVFFSGLRVPHSVFSNHQIGWLVNAALWSLFGERGGDKSPLDKLKRRQHMWKDGLACSKWPQGSHFPQCSHSPGSLVSICPLWAKAFETHCGHHGLEEIWQIQKTDPVSSSPPWERNVLLIDSVWAELLKALLVSLDGCQIH